MWSAIPEETAVQTHFYSVEKPDGSMDTSFETYLSEVEGQAAPVYENILKGVVPKNAQPKKFAPIKVARRSKKSA